MSQEQYARAALRVAVAQMCQSFGFSRISPRALHALTDVVSVEKKKKKKKKKKSKFSKTQRNNCHSWSLTLTKLAFDRVNTRN
jgi:hypothetical protein